MILTDIKISINFKISLFLSKDDDLHCYNFFVVVVVVVVIVFKSFTFNSIHCGSTATIPTSKEAYDELIR